MAAVAAAVRDVTPSLPRMLATWVCAVRCPMNSASAIPRSVRPATTSRNTSSSRSVRPCAAETAWFGQWRQSLRRRVAHGEGFRARGVERERSACLPGRNEGLLVQPRSYRYDVSVDLILIDRVEDEPPRLGEGRRHAQEASRLLRTAPIQSDAGQTVQAENSPFQPADLPCDHQGL